MDRPVPAVESRAGAAESSAAAAGAAVGGAAGASCSEIELPQPTGMLPEKRSSASVDSSASHSPLRRRPDGTQLAELCTLPAFQQLSTAQRGIIQRIASMLDT